MELLDDALTNTNNAFSVPNFDNFSIQNVEIIKNACNYGQTYKSWDH